MSDINPSVASAAQNPPASARLEAGLTAPDFTLPSDNGGSVTLSALRGQNIILYFYPAAMTPGTTSHASLHADSPYSAYRRIRWTGSSDSASAII
jgi:peroxiredoxin Q/BCP